METEFQKIQTHELLHLAERYDRDGVKILLNQINPVRESMTPQMLVESEQIVATNFTIAEGLRREAARRVDHVRKFGTPLPETEG